MLLTQNSIITFVILTIVLCTTVYFVCFRNGQIAPLSYNVNDSSNTLSLATGTTAWKNAVKKTDCDVDGDDKNQRWSLWQICPLTRIPSHLHEYVTLEEEKNDDDEQRGTGIYPRWYTDVSQFLDMFEFQHQVLRYVCTESNNSLSTIGTYVRAVDILCDFITRVGKRKRELFADWRMYVSVTSAHFTRCLMHVRDSRLRRLARNGLWMLMREPYAVNGRDVVDDVTAYRLAHIWIAANMALGRKNWRGNFSYTRMLDSLRDKLAPLYQNFYHEPLPYDTAIKLRDGGRLLQGIVPFYGDYWHKWVFSYDLRSLDDRVENMLDIEKLDVLVHAQIKHCCFGLFGPGTFVPRHSLWPSTKLGVGVIPSIGFLRMYGEKYAFSCRQMKRDLPFYSYRAGHFNVQDMHTFVQQRLFSQLSDNEDGGRFATNTYHPGSVVLGTGETEEWVLENCSPKYLPGNLIALYPIEASGTVMATRSIGVMVQRYELFRGLRIEEFVLLDYRNGRMYLHILINNRTDTPNGMYYTSYAKSDIVRQFRDRLAIFAYADFDDPSLITRSICKSLTLPDFLARTDNSIQFSTFLFDGHIYYTLKTDDGTRTVEIISRDDMIGMPRNITVRDREYWFDDEYNQYVNIAERAVASTTTTTHLVSNDEELAEIEIVNDTVPL